MIYIETESTKGSLNLAYEEYFLKNKNLDEDILMLWRNEPTIVIGAFQNTYEEINEDFVKAQDIKVNRRTSGGGAVYHDLGNLCFTFISKQENFTNTDYSLFLQPVVEALAKMGVYAEVSGRNDLLIDGKKISGSASRIYKDKLLFHGTLLFSSDLGILEKALVVDKEKLSSKGIKSIKARVTTIQNYLPDKLDVLEFKDKLLKVFMENKNTAQYFLSSKEKKEVANLAKNKYESFDWIYGKNPASDMTNSQRFEGGKVKVKLSLEKGYIKKCYFEGDFLGCEDIQPIESLLIGIPYEEVCIREIFKNLDTRLYFGSIEKEELISCIMGKVWSQEML